MPFYLFICSFIHLRQILSRVPLESEKHKLANKQYLEMINRRQVFSVAGKEDGDGDSEERTFCQ